MAQRRPQTGPMENFPTRLTSADFLLDRVTLNTLWHMGRNHLDRMNRIGLCATPFGLVAFQSVGVVASLPASQAGIHMDAMPGIRHSKNSSATYHAAAVLMLSPSYRW